jgi:hypothetical protein
MIHLPKISIQGRKDYSPPYSSSYLAHYFVGVALIPSWYRMTPWKKACRNLSSQRMVCLLLPSRRVPSLSGIPQSRPFEADRQDDSDSSCLQFAEVDVSSPKIVHEGCVSGLLV